MSRVLITESLLTDIANAIRGKLGVGTTYAPGEMAEAIRGIALDAVKYTTQSLTSAQQTQARENIGAAGAAETEAALNGKAGTAAVQALQTALEGKADADDMEAALNGKASVSRVVDAEADISDIKTALNGKASAADLQALSQTVAGKQDALTFDSTPTRNSPNPVTSGGIYEAVANAGRIEAMTMAQYEALTQAQKMDGTARFITDVNSLSAAEGVGF